MRPGGRFRLAGVAAFVALASVLGPAAPSQAQGFPGASLLPLSAAPVPRLPRTAVDLGAVAARQVIRLEVTLKVPDPRALSAFIAGISDRSSPLFGHFLRRGQFGPRFGPSLAEVAAVQNALRAQGLSAGPVTADRLAIPGSGPATAVERAFGTALASYRLPGGRVAYANSAAPRVATAVAPYVAGVVGLSDLALPHSQARWPRPARSAGPGRTPDGQLPDSRIASAQPAADAGFQERSSSRTRPLTSARTSPATPSTRRSGTCTSTAEQAAAGARARRRWTSRT